MEEIFEMIMEVFLDLVENAVDSRRCPKPLKIILVCITAAIVIGVAAALFVIAFRRNETEPALIAVLYIVIIIIWVICGIKKRRKK